MNEAFQPELLRRYAAQFQRQASFVRWYVPLAITLAGVIYGYFLRLPPGTEDPSGPYFEMVIYGLIGLMLGISFGQVIATRCKIRAQELLCLCEIEERTRR